MKDRCWYCRKRKRKDNNSLFCSKCDKIRVKDKQSGIYIIYNKM